jgi:hypothetical protein
MRITGSYGPDKITIFIAESFYTCNASLIKQANLIESINFQNKNNETMDRCKKRWNGATQTREPPGVDIS